VADLRRPSREGAAAVVRTSRAWSGRSNAADLERHLANPGVRSVIIVSLTGLIAMS